MKKFGLVGFPLEHSFSEKYFTEKFDNENIDAEYKLYPLNNIQDVRTLLENEPELVGLNVTIPYKKQIINYLTDIDINAQKIGAVNTLKIERKGKIFIKGYNTDIYGFEILLEEFDYEGKKALVLGSGGAAAAVCFVLSQKGIPHKVVSRNEKNGDVTYNDLTSDDIKDNKLIINTTPLGMFPNAETCPPIDYDAVGKNHLLIDLVYNPSETLFMKEGRRRGAAVANGLKMLHAQAEAAYSIWADDEKITLTMNKTINNL